jgi:hypothetical protein
MKTRACYLTAIALAAVQTGTAYSHGVPIIVGQSAGTLVVSNGQADTEGFASQFFVEVDEENGPFTATLPNVGPAIIWPTPGFSINGLNNQSSLSIEVIARPVNGANPPEERILWYWDPEDEAVEPADSNFYLLGTDLRFQTLLPDAEVAPPPFLLTATLSGHQGTHNHDLLGYALDNHSPPAVGAYGFFARLVSNLGAPPTHYAASEPFLLVFNHGVDLASMVDAALAINAAAAATDGDFNHDGMVDAADYVVWRKSIGTAPEYAAWRANFGMSVGTGSGGSTAMVPEPTFFTLSAAVLISFSNVRRRRNRHMNSRSREDHR